MQYTLQKYKSIYPKWVSKEFYRLTQSNLDGHSDVIHDRIMIYPTGATINIFELNDDGSNAKYAECRNPVMIIPSYFTTIINNPELPNTAEIQNRFKHILE